MILIYSAVYNGVPSVFPQFYLSLFGIVYLLKANL